MKYSFRIDVALINFGAKIVFFTKRDKDILGNAEKSSALTSRSGLVVETFCKTPLRTVAINENCFCCVWFDVIYNKVYIRHKLKTQGKQIQRNVPCDKSYTKTTGKNNGFLYRPPLLNVPMRIGAPAFARVTLRSVNGQKTRNGGSKIINGNSWIIHGNSCLKKATIYFLTHVDCQSHLNCRAASRRDAISVTPYVVWGLRITHRYDGLRCPIRA